MSKLFSLVRRAPKRFIAAALVLAAVIVVPAMGHAWGPSRDTFTQAKPADHVTFNSITDNPQVGDERNFVRIKESGTSTYTDGVTLTPGKVYDVSVYYHNNAAANLNLVAHGVTLKMEVPQVVKAGVNAAFTGTISSSNATPTKVWDEAYGKNATKGDVLLRYVSKSATFVSNGKVNGTTLPDSLFTTGAKLGYNQADGNLPGCNQYAGFVNFKIRVDQPNFEVKKLVSTDEGATWNTTATAKPGQTVLYGLSYKNTGTNQQDNVVVRDILPKNVTYVKNSTYIINALTGGQYKKTIEGITTSGINVGSYQPNANLFYKFSATMPSADKLVCGKNTLVNTLRVTTNAGYKEAQATVTVNKDCQPPKQIKVCELATKKIITINEDDFDAKKYSKNLDDCKVTPPTPKPVYTCDLLSASKIDRNVFKFTAKATAKDGATVKDYSFDFGDGTKVTQNSNVAQHTYAKDGDFTVKVTVNFTVDGKTVSNTSEDCSACITVVPVPPVKIQVCELATKKVVTINEDDFDAKKYSKNLDDCKETPKQIKVCELETKKIITIDEKDFDSSKYSKNLDDCKETPTPKEIQVCELDTKKIVTINEDDFDASKYSKDLNDCKVTPPTPEQIQVCELKTKKIVTIDEDQFDTKKYSKDLNDCKETPVTPELPHTGISAGILSVLGLGSLAASTLYYIASRRN